MDILHAHDETPPRDEVSASRWLLPALIVGVVLFVIATAAHAGLYKWTDDKGVVHYSDRLPADAVNRANVELNREGIAIRKTSKAAPPAQHATSQAEQERERDLARERTASARRDRALLDSYSNVGEIDLARHRALSTIDAQIASATSYIADITKRRDGLVAQKATYGTRPVPDGITRELASADAELVRQQAYVTARRSEAATVTARYDADRLRYQELTHPLPPRSASAGSPVELSSAVQGSAARN